MELSNAVRATLQAGGRGPAVAEALTALATMLSPICPHVAEELWHRLGHEGLVAAVTWPTYDEALLVEATKRIVVQVDGRVRDTVVVPAGTAQDEVEAQGRSLDNVARHLDGRDLVKVVWLPDRLLNFVTRSSP
jgi:leucyl-tRNA synthetase